MKIIIILWNLKIYNRYKWDDSILFLSSMNSLYIFLKEKWKKSNDKTKKILIQTKKVSKRKTRRKRLKNTHT